MGTKLLNSSNFLSFYCRGSDAGGELQSQDEMVDSFECMNLKEDVLKGIYACGFEKPSALQQCAIVPLTRKHDVIAQTSSDTGKTTSIAISALHLVDEYSNDCQVIILAPTKQKATQTLKVINRFWFIHTYVFSQGC